MIISPPILLPRNENEHEDEWIDRCMIGDAPGRGAYPLSHEFEWHGGLHLSAPRNGTRAAEICAVADGKVVFVRQVTVASPSEQDHPLNYFDGYTSDACIVLEHRMQICQGDSGSFTYYSVYHHLTGLNEKLSAGATVRRRDPIGFAGRIYTEKDRFHFEICCDDANLRKLVGRTGGPLSTNADGRADLVFGEIYFVIPAGVPVYANEPAHFRSDGHVQPPRSKPSSPLPPTQAQAAASTTTAEIIVGVRSDRWLGSAPGGLGTTTYRQDGSELATVADTGDESTLSKTAARIVATWESAQKAHPQEYPEIPTVGAVLQLLRYGRITAPPSTPLNPANAPHWRKIKYDGGEGWLNLNADNVRKFSDADFPHWKGWLLVDDDSAATDCK
ncbi:M23 family metallopeptidase [Massilia sp. DWR3-1-1]|uniref:M23 family metallopeptidase n=1 Tax=Massilia sp. DWR3-1-1 TaxID=2804559 RepID=UPI003CEA4C45